MPAMVWAFNLSLRQRFEVAFEYLE